MDEGQKREIGKDGVVEKGWKGSKEKREEEARRGRAGKLNLEGAVSCDINLRNVGGNGNTEFTVRFRTTCLTNIGFAQR